MTPVIPIVTERKGFFFSEFQILSQWFLNRTLIKDSQYLFFQEEFVNNRDLRA